MTNTQSLIERLRAAEWAKIPGFEYEASNCGLIRNAQTQRILKPKITPKGYHEVTLVGGDQKKQVRVHRAVFAAWSGDWPDGWQVNHLNTVKSDNRFENLEKCTPKENVQHAIRMGLFPSGDRNGTRTRPDRLRRGERNGSSVLTAEKVRNIRNLKQQGRTQVSIALEYGISESTVSSICRGKAWQHVS